MEVIILTTKFMSIEMWMNGFRQVNVFVLLSQNTFPKQNVQDISTNCLHGKCAVTFDKSLKASDGFYCKWKLFNLRWKHFKAFQ